MFEEEVDVDTAHLLMSLWDRLTYHSQMTPTLAADLRSLTGLELLGVRREDGQVTAYGSTMGTLGGGDATLLKVAGSLAPMELGETLIRMAELNQIPITDREKIREELRGAGIRQP